MIERISVPTRTHPQGNLHQRTPIGMRASKLVGLLHPGWDIALAMQHTPHVDLIDVLGIKDQL